jgi:hypothetical protein
MSTRGRIGQIAAPISIALLVAAFVYYQYAERQLGRAYQLGEDSYVLSDMLRQTSDDLTRMVRTYVATEDPIYKQHYQEILDIRNGLAPRPDDYGAIS